MEGLKNATPDSGGDVMTSSNKTVNNVTYSRADLVAANDEMAMTLLPAMLVLGVLIVLGVLGNSLVCYIFCFRLRPSTQNYLIVYLAVFDLLSSTIGMPGEIADLRYIIMYESDAACKIIRFVETFCSTGSSFTLVVIAVDRFRKVCRPLKNQLSIKHIKYSLIPIIGAAIILSWPIFFTNGLRTTESGLSGFPGTDCSASAFVDGVQFTFIYNGIQFMIFIVIITSLLVTYLCVLRETKRRVRYMRNNAGIHPTHTESVHHEDSTNVDQNSSAVSSTTQSSLLERHQVHTSSEIPQACTGSVSEPVESVELSDMPASGIPDEVKSSHLPFSNSTDNDNNVSTTSVNLTSSMSNTGITPKPIPPCVKAEENKEKRTKRFQNKATIIAFLITLVFILSFLPYLSLQVAKIVFKGFDAELEGAGLVFYNIFVRSYFLNSVLNPFIYGAFNTNFKEEVKKVVSSLRTFCHRK